jgi:hypothetical protein
MDVEKEQKYQQQHSGDKAGYLNPFSQESERL